jgi:hypothetical protein
VAKHLNKDYYQKQNDLWFIRCLCWVGIWVSTAVKIWFVVFWVVTQCRRIGGYQRFRGTHRLPYLSLMKYEAKCSSKTLLTKATQRHNPKDHNLGRKCASNITFSLLFLFIFSICNIMMNTRKENFQDYQA